MPSIEQYFSDFSFTSFPYLSLLSSKLPVRNLSGNGLNVIKLV